MAKHHETRAAFCMAAPALSGLLIFVGLPFVLALGLSLTNLRFGSPLPLEFMGLEQFRRLAGDDAFGRAILNNCLFAVIVVPVQTALALGLALLLNNRLTGMALFRTLFFLPVVFPLSLVAVVWMLIYGPGPTGLMNILLAKISQGLWAPQDFLRHPYLALPAIMLTSIWQGCGFQMVIILAGLQSIPAELYEAAALDGAGRWPRFLHVTLPGLRNTLIFVVLVTTILAFRLFDQVQIMTQGGPNLATTTIMYETVQAAFARQQVAKGAAMTVILFIIVLTITMIQRFLLKQEREIS